MHLLFSPISASLHLYSKTDISLDKIFQVQRFKCRWNNAALAANGCPRGHNYSIWRRLVSLQPWQVKSNVIVQWKAAPCFVLAVLTTSRFSIHFSCWEEHRFARTKASPVNISHWLAGQMYFYSPSLFLPLSYLSSSLSVFHSLHTHSIPASSSSVSASPICPSIFCLPPSISHSRHSSHPLSLCVFLSFLLVLPRLKCPEGPSFKHRNQKHMAHFQLPRSITAIYPEIAAKFPKVSSRFTTDCNVCLSHFKSGQFALLLSTLFPSKNSKAFKWVLDMFYLWLSCAPSFLPQLC